MSQFIGIISGYHFLFTLEFEQDHIYTHLFLLVVVFSGTVLGKWEQDGQMDQNLWLSAPFVLEEVTPTVSLFKDKKAHFGGTLIAHG